MGDVILCGKNSDCDVREDIPFAVTSQQRESFWTCFGLEYVELSGEFGDVDAVHKTAFSTGMRITSPKRALERDTLRCWRRDIAAGARC